MISHIDFIGIGSPKCGTTLLANVLSRHPNVVLPNVFSGKELNFFAFRYGYDNYRKGIDWYLRQFDPTPDALAYGEFSPSYFSDGVSPKYIHSHFPNAKLIAILRDPAKRAFSTYQQDKKACRIPAAMSFSDAIKESPKTLLDSYYVVHLRRYLDYFPRSQLHVVFMEELLSQPSDTIEKLVEFLELPKNDLGNCIDGKVNEAWLPRSYMVQNVLWSLARGARRAGLQKMVHLLRRLGPGEWIQGLNKGAAETLASSEHAQLSTVFEEENQELCELLKRTSLPWSQESTNQHTSRAA